MRSPGRTSPKRHGGHRHPRGGPAPGGGVEGGEVERLVEDAGVDGVGAGGGGVGDRRVALHEVGLGRPQARATAAASSAGRDVHRSTRASRVDLRASVSAGNDSEPRSNGLPRRGADLPSDGGSRISTATTLGWGSGRPDPGAGPVTGRGTPMPRRVVHVTESGLEADGELLRRGVAAIQQELGVTPEFPAEVRRRGRGVRTRPRGCRPWTAPTSPSSRSTPRRRATSTRRCTSSATATATSCTTPSPTWRRS